MMPACARIDLSRPGPIVSPACRGIVTRPLRSGCLSCTCEPLWATTSHPRRRSAFMISRPVRRGSGGTLLPYGDRAWMVAATGLELPPNVLAGHAVFSLNRTPRGESCAGLLTRAGRAALTLIKSRRRPEWHSAAIRDRQTGQTLSLEGARPSA